MLNDGLSQAGCVPYPGFPCSVHWVLALRGSVAPATSLLLLQGDHPTPPLGVAQASGWDVGFFSEKNGMVLVSVPDGVNDL